MQASQSYGTRLICSVLQRVAACGSVLQRVAVRNDIRIHGSIPIIRDMTHLQRVAACCSVLQRVAACCSVLQCVAVCTEGPFLFQIPFLSCKRALLKKGFFARNSQQFSKPINYWIIETPLQPHKMGSLLQHLLQHTPYVKSPFFHDTIQQALPSACSARSISLLHMEKHTYTYAHTYGVATISRLLKIIGLFCKRAL